MASFKLKTGKIVGTGSEGYWAQTHIFIPQEISSDSGEKDHKFFYGNLLASFCIQAKQDNLDIASFGKEVISYFHESYYSSEEGDILKRLKKSLTRVLEEFSGQIELQAVISVVVEKEGYLLGYFLTSGSGKIFIYRKNKLVNILNEQKEKTTASGVLEDKDILVLGTRQFYKTLDRENIKTAFSNGDVSSAIEDLAPKIHSSANYKTAAVIFKTIKMQENDNIQERKIQKGRRKTEKQQISKKTKKKINFNFNGLKSFFSNFVLFFKKTKKDFKTQPRVFVKDKKKKNKAKKTTLSVAVVLIVLLVISIFMGSKKKDFLEQEQKKSDFYKEAEYKLDQARSLSELNPLRAKSLLQETKSLIEDAKEEVKSEKAGKQMEQLLSEVERELEQVGGVYKIDSAELFLDLTLIKEDFEGVDWDSSEGNLLVLDNDSNTVLEIGVEDKKSAVVAGGEKIANAFQIGASEDKAFVVKDDNLLVVNTGKGSVSDDKKGEDWGEINSIIGFSENAYLLDSDKNAIWKYAKSGAGVADSVNYLENEGVGLRGAVDMAIDGMVWVLFKNGNIYKFVRGKRDNFLLTGLDEEFDNPEKIFTDAESDNIYVLDRMKTRIVAVDKETGEYRSQYLWPGISGAKDLFVSEEQGKLLMLMGERIYQLELKN